MLHFHSYSAISFLNTKSFFDINHMKCILFLLPIVMCCMACNQQAGKSVLNKSKDEHHSSSYNSEHVKHEEEYDSNHLVTSHDRKDTNGVVYGKEDVFNEHFTIMSTISRDWISGVYGGGSGTEYTITITILTNKQLDFDSLWINNSLLKLFVAQESNISNMQIKIKKGDKITLRATDIHDKNAMSNIRPPFNFIGEALLYFRVNDERKYYIVSEIQNQPTIYHK